MCYPNNYFYYTERINLIAKYTNDFKYFFVWGGGTFLRILYNDLICYIKSAKNISNLSG